MNCVNLQTIYPYSRPKMFQDGDMVNSYAPSSIPVEVPCGKCIACLVNKRSDWSFRLEQEWKASRSALFVTLTYDQKHCPSDGSLDKSHVQKYLKRLRKRDGTNKIRYYAVGEYGGASHRPHYHLLLFNCNEQDARASWTDHKGNPVGIVHIGYVTAASVAYVTKYVVQPELAIPHLQKPFSLMSRAYGIGGKYLTDEMVQWHRDDDRNYTMRYDQKGRLPRFYRDKIWYRPEDKTRVSQRAKSLVLENREKEIAYYQKKHPKNWEEVMRVSRNALLLRVKKKVAYTQTL